MDPKDVIKDAIAQAAAKTTAAGKALPDAIRGVLSPGEEKMLVSSNKDIKEGKTFPIAPAAPVEPERIRTEPIWPIDPETVAEFKKRIASERKEADQRREAFLKECDSPENLARVRAAAVAAVAAMPTRHVRSSEEKPVKEKAVKEKKEKKKSQNRLGQTKLIDTLLKAGKSEAEIIAEVKEKIPLYPAEKIPQMIKLRRYHVK